MQAVLAKLWKNLFTPSNKVISFHNFSIKKNFKTVPERSISLKYTPFIYIPTIQRQFLFQPLASKLPNITARRMLLYVSELYV